MDTTRASHGDRFDLEVQVDQGEHQALEVLHEVVERHEALGILGVLHLTTPHHTTPPQQTQQRLAHASNARGDQTALTHSSVSVPHTHNQEERQVIFKGLKKGLKCIHKKALAAMALVSKLWLSCTIS
eukprot:TRINITY_DN1353_c0_g1_i2.p1 TRINITY_DN1353_c0_g1~~TRINITY_DN1353_c0_g1_i2.p1  ORF type:complete len:128 (+),score=9.58 TRINITY_DN1353_c0_g1_i2:34-417(+)